MGNTPLKNLKMFKKLCGEDFFKKVVLVTTMWPIPDSTAKGYQEEMISCEEREKELETIYWSDMINHGSKTWRFLNSKESTCDIIDYIIDIESQKRCVRIQEEMVAQGKKLPNTDAGRQLHGITQELIDRQNDLFRRMKVELGETADQTVIQALLKEMSELQKDREKALKDMRQLDTNGLSRLIRRFRESIPRKCSLAYDTPGLSLKLSPRYLASPTT
jgi:arsenate reductase-like glutaredoxin family protein